MTPPDPDRRRLVVAITQGGDTKSITSVPSLERVARRTDAVLHIVSVRPPPPDRGGDVFPDGTRVIFEEGASSSPFELTMGFGSMVRYRGSTTEERELFETLPGRTGGVFHGPGRWGRNPNVVAAIRDLIAEFRQSYVIQYTPRDVAPGGWHEVVVRVKGVDPAGVRTRAGYVDTDQ